MDHGDGRTVTKKAMTYCNEADYARGIRVATDRGIYLKADER
jgi:hypothetical protein